MKIKICPVGILKTLIQAQVIEVQTGTTVRQIIDRLEFREKVNVMAFVNGKRREHATCLCEGEEVKLISLLSGG